MPMIAGNAKLLLPSASLFDTKELVYCLVAVAQVPNIHDILDFL